MEVVEIVSYYIYEDAKRMEVSFRFSIDSEDEIRNDIINLDEADEYGYPIIESGSDFFDVDEYDVDDDEFDTFDEFETIDEDMLLSFLNEYYIVNPNKVPKLESL